MSDTRSNSTYYAYLTNKLTTLPVEIVQLNRLTALYLGENQLTALLAAPEQLLADLRAAGCSIYR